MTVTGVEKLPHTGPYILICNHMSIADVAILFVTLPEKVAREIRFFAGEKWEAIPIFGWLLSWRKAIYIKRTEFDRAGLKKGLDALHQGAIFGLAPEGSRSKIGKMGRAKDGAAYLATRTKSPLVPVALVNNDRIFASMRRFRRYHLEVHFGDPFSLPDAGKRPTGTKLSALSHYLMIQIALLLPERYHGYYAQQPLLLLQQGNDPWSACLEAESGANNNPKRDVVSTLPQPN